MENLFKRSVKGLAYWFFGEVLCFFICTMSSGLMHNVLIIKVFIGLCVLIVTLGLYFNYTYYAAKKDRKKVRYHNAERDKRMPYKMALAAPFPAYIMWILLLLSKAGIIRDIFNQYILTDIFVLPFVSMFTEGRTIDNLSWAGLIGIMILTLLAPLTIIITYELTYREIDVVKQVIYKKQDK